MKKLLIAALAILPLTACNNISEELREDGGTAVSCTTTGKMDLADTNRDEVLVTFDHFPETLADWVATRALLKSTPEGTILTELMAYELYRNKSKAGERAVVLNSTTSAATEAMQRLPEIFGKATGGDTQYARPYIVWSYLRGATPDNGYQPTKPYTIVVRDRPNSRQWSEFMGGYIYTFEVYSDGYDTLWRAVQLLLLDGEWSVFSSPALYTQCKKSRM